MVRSTQMVLQTTNLQVVTCRIPWDRSPFVQLLLQVVSDSCTCHGSRQPRWRPLLPFGDSVAQLHEYHGENRLEQFETSSLHELGLSFQHNKHTHISMVQNPLSVEHRTELMQLRDFDAVECKNPCPRTIRPHCLRAHRT